MDIDIGDVNAKDAYEQDLAYLAYMIAAVTGLSEKGADPTLHYSST